MMLASLEEGGRENDPSAYNGIIAEVNTRSEWDGFREPEGPIDIAGFVLRTRTDARHAVLNTADTVSRVRNIGRKVETLYAVVMLCLIVVALNLGFTLLKTWW